MTQIESLLKEDIASAVIAAHTYFVSHPAHCGALSWLYAGDFKSSHARESMVGCFQPLCFTGDLLRATELRKAYENARLFDYSARAGLFTLPWIAKREIPPTIGDILRDSHLNNNERLIVHVGKLTRRGVFDCLPDTEKIDFIEYLETCVGAVYLMVKDIHEKIENSPEFCSRIRENSSIESNGLPYKEKIEAHDNRLRLFAKQISGIDKRREFLEQRTRELEGPFWEQQLNARLGDYVRTLDYMTAEWKYRTVLLPSIFLIEKMLSACVAVSQTLCSKTEKKEVCT